VRLDLIPPLKSESFNCSRSPACGASAAHSSGASEIQETWSSEIKIGPPARSQRIHILAENAEDPYLIITSRFNSFRSSLVLSISSAAFPTMT
jgi:hypothetical protein